jgi:hypothetical protein
VRSAVRSYSFEESVREYIRLSVALGERDPDGLDYYYGPAERVADVRAHPPTLSVIKNSALAATQRLADDSEQRFLLGQLRAIAARADMLLGTRRTFDEETLALFDLRLTPLDTNGLTIARMQIARLLPGKGSLAARYAALDENFTIPRERLPAVMARAIEACREQTQAHWQLPPDEKVTLEYVHDKPWSAFSRYQGSYRSVIQINTDFGLTVDRALQLACHEGYPGHHVFNSLTDQYLARGQHRNELFVQPTFSPQSLLSEAAATVAPEVAFPFPERLRFERDVLFPIAGLNPAEAERHLEVAQGVEALHPAELSIARNYLDGKLEFVRAAAALEDQALMAHAEATLRYLNEYRSYVVTYTEASDILRKWLSGRTGAARSGNSSWEPFRELFQHPGVFPHPE